MNTNANPAAASDLSSRDNPCYGRDSTVATLNVFADDERSYQLPYAQFLYAERIPNPALEKDAEAPPETLLICFAAAKVTLLGRGIKTVERMIQNYEFKFSKCADAHYIAALKTSVTAAA